MTLSLTLHTLCTLRVFQPIKRGGYGGMVMREQNEKVMQMTTAQLADIVENGDRNTFLHFQAERKLKARLGLGVRRVNQYPLPDDPWDYYRNNCSRY